MAVAECTLLHTDVNVQYRLLKPVLVAGTQQDGNIQPHTVERKLLWVLPIIRCDHFAPLLDTTGEECYIYYR